MTNPINLIHDENYNVTWKLTIAVQDGKPLAKFVTNFWHIFSEESVAEDVSRWHRLGREREELKISICTVDTPDEATALSQLDADYFSNEQNPIYCVGDEIRFNGGFLCVTSPVQAMIDAVERITGLKHNEDEDEENYVVFGERYGTCLRLKLAAVPVLRTRLKSKPDRSEVKIMNRNIYFEAEINPSFEETDYAPIFSQEQYDGAMFTVGEQMEQQKDGEERQLRRIRSVISEDERITVTFELDQAGAEETYHDIILNQDSDKKLTKDGLIPTNPRSYYFETFVDTLPLKYALPQTTDPETCEKTSTASTSVDIAQNSQPGGIHDFNKRGDVYIGYEQGKLFRGAMRRIIFDPGADSGSAIVK